MSSVLSSIFFFLIALGLLIAIHEFGHYWVARRLGVKVLKFSIGFGKPLWKTTRGADNTEYALAAIPLGGYVRMLDEREGEVAPHELHRAFNRQPVGKRFAIVVAGPLFNFVLAIAAYWLVFLIGITTIKPVVGEVAPESPAAEAGFTSGDQIVAVADEATPGWQNVALTIIEKALDEDRVPVEVKDVQGEPVDDWEDWGAYVRAHPEQVIRTEVVRGGEHLVFNITPKLRATKEGDIGYVGAAVAMPEANDAEHELTAVVRYSPLAAVGEAMAKTWLLSVLTLRMLWGMVAGEVSVSIISGPISIAQYAGYSAQGGIVSFLTFIAIVSISLGVLNLLPVPVLDGGHLLYYIIEWIKCSPVSDAVQAFGQRIGVTALLLLMVVAVYNDV